MNYGGSTFFEQGGRLLLNFLLAIWLGPEMLGIWFTLNLIIRFSPFTSIGGSHGLAREISLNLKKGDQDISESLNDVFSLFFIVHIVFVPILPLIFPESLIQGKIHLIYLTLLLSFLTQSFGLIRSKLRAEIKFDFLGVIQWKYTVIWLITSVIFLYYFKLEGFISAGIFSYIIIIAAINFKSTVLNYFKLNWNYKSKIPLMKEGFPIMLVGFSFTIMATIDRMLIIYYFDNESLGYYSFASIFFTALSMIVMLFSQLYYPRMLDSWSRYSDLLLLKALMRSQKIFSFGLVLPASLFLIFGAGFFIKWLAPEYIVSIRVLQIISVAPIFLSISNIYGNFLNTINKQYYYLLTLIGSSIINLLAGILFIKEGFGLEGVALSTVISYAFYSFLNFIISRRLISKLNAGTPPTTK